MEVARISIIFSANIMSMPKRMARPRTRPRRPKGFSIRSDLIERMNIARVTPKRAPIRMRPSLKRKMRARPPKSPTPVKEYITLYFIIVTIIITIPPEHA